MQAIVEGIKIVGVGKKGSKPLTADLISDISKDLKKGQVPEIQKGAFFAGLLMKGATKEEEVLLKDFSLEPFLKGVSPEIQQICQDLVGQKELNVTSAYELGTFLFSNQEGDGARGLIASLLRVRYETQDEYEGLLKAMEETFEPSFKGKIPKGSPIIQMAEPFDGVSRSYLNTPLWADLLAAKNYRVVSLVGRNSGPKYGNNLLDLAEGLSASFIQNTEEFIEPKAYYIAQKNLSSAMDAWVERRQAIIKRPFLATLERFVNPVKCDILIASAFHAPYGDRMIHICERAGISASVIVRNGLEGTCLFPLLRTTKVLVSVRKDGRYLRKEFILTPPKGFKMEEKLTNPSLQENIRLIEAYQTKGKTDNKHFDARIQYMHTSLTEVLDWIGRQN